MNVQEAKEVLRKHEEIKDKQHREKEALEKRRVETGWKHGIFTATNVTRERKLNRLFSNVRKLWRIRCENTYNHEVRGMSYYATNENVLMSDGGGTCVLQSGRIITETEKDQLDSGKVPERLLWKKDYDPQEGME